MKKVAEKKPTLGVHSGKIGFLKKKIVRPKKNG